MDCDTDKKMNNKNESNEPWQCGLTNLNQRTKALFRNRNFTDLTLTFPESDITFEVHRLILAMTSPVFESILYGPMRTKGETVELHDDPLIMKYLLAYCYGTYGYSLEIPDMNSALELYKLADKYILNDLKIECCNHIVNLMSEDNVKGVIEFAVKFNFNDFMKYHCSSYLCGMFRDIMNKFEQASCYEDEPDFKVSSAILMCLNDEWIEEIIPQVTNSLMCLDFHESWKYPKSPLLYNRLSIILSKIMCGDLKKFYGCINAENICQFNLNLELCLSVTDPHHAKGVIEAINQQKRFEKQCIAIHICCEDAWPRNWISLLQERTYRPSMLLISDADDDKIAWIIEAAKALLPQREGSINKKFELCKCEVGSDTCTVTPVTILKFPRSKFTLLGLTSLMQGLHASGVKFKKILMQSPNITSDQQIQLQQYSRYFQCLPMEHDFFNNVFEEFPEIRIRYW